MPKLPFNLIQFSFFFEYLPQIIIAIIIAIVLGLLYYCRDLIKKTMFAHRVKPLLKQAVSTYEEKVLPEYISKAVDVANALFTKGFQTLKLEHGNLSNLRRKNCILYAYLAKKNS